MKRAQGRFLATLSRIKSQANASAGEETRNRFLKKTLSMENWRNTTSTAGMKDQWILTPAKSLKDQFEGGALRYDYDFD
jgi:enterochelin esterase-like enzyme